MTCCRSVVIIKFVAEIFLTRCRNVVIIKFVAETSVTSCRYVIIVPTQSKWQNDENTGSMLGISWANKSVHARISLFYDSRLSSIFICL